MILDNSLLLGDAQTITTGASTNVVDTLAAGDSYEGAWLYVAVNEVFVTAGTAGTLQIQLQTSSLENFEGSATQSVTLSQSAAIAEATLVAGYEMYKVRIPPGAKRYLRTYMVVGTDTGTITTGKLDMYIAKDAPINQP